jgi:hypothetical protein
MTRNAELDQQLHAMHKRALDMSSQLAAGTNGKVEILKFSKFSVE